LRLAEREKATAERVKREQEEEQEFLSQGDMFAVGLRNLIETRFKDKNVEVKVNHITNPRTGLRTAEVTIVQQVRFGKGLTPRPTVPQGQGKYQMLVTVVGTNQFHCRDGRSLDVTGDFVKAGNVVLDWIGAP
jgi:hypothetical protein